VTVTAKGQITIPANLRRKLEIAEGEQLMIVCEGEILKIIPIPRLSKLAGADKEIFRGRKPSEEIEKTRKEWDKNFEKRVKEA
jgi:AbrB family looped-hinge helix DNA binding protein